MHPLKVLQGCGPQDQLLHIPPCFTDGEAEAGRGLACSAHIAETKLSWGPGF